MAEFCFECWNKITGKNEKETDYVLSEDYDLCECCGMMKHVIVEKRHKYCKNKIVYKIFIALRFLWRRILCFIYKHI